MFYFVRIGETPHGSPANMWLSPILFLLIGI